MVKTSILHSKCAFDGISLSFFVVCASLIVVQVFQFYRCPGHFFLSLFTRICSFFVGCVSLSASFFSFCTKQFWCNSVKGIKNALHARCFLSALCGLFFFSSLPLCCSLVHCQPQFCQRTIQWINRLIFQQTLLVHWTVQLSLSLSLLTQESHLSLSYYISVCIKMFFVPKPSHNRKKEKASYKRPKLSLLDYDICLLLFAFIFQGGGSYFQLYILFLLFFSFFMQGGKGSKVC